MIPAAVWARVTVTDNGTGCGLCGGKGCANCLSGLKGRCLHGKLASIAGAFNKPKISWFIGAGGPVRSRRAMFRTSSPPVRLAISSAFRP